MPDMDCFWQVLLATTVLFAYVTSQPSCTFNEDTLITFCVPGDQDYLLNRGLVSDNNETDTIILRSCRINGIGLNSFHGLPNLKNLDLSANKLRRLRLGVLDGMTEVTHLNLSYNLLTDLPLGLFDQKPKLELLDLKGNRINNFPLGIFDPFSRLGFLDISSNAFLGRNLDEHLFDKTTVITVMDFSGSDMAETPDNLLKTFKIINFLNLSGCSLRNVPLFATASNLRTMLHLMMINNLITEIVDPDTFKNLVNLEMLDFGGNSIETLHPDVFKPLRKLKSVVLFDNNLKEIPETLFTGSNKLEKVDLSKNMIEYVPVNAFRSTRLKFLNLSNNRFTYLSNNFVLELRNSNALLSKFYFNNNPFQCACLNDILKEVKQYKIGYNDNAYDGKHKACVTTAEFNCQRQPSVNEKFIELYYNSV